MAILTNPRHELFAQELAKGKSASEAYTLAGYRPCRQNAARLTTKDDIQARLTELQSEAAQASVVTVSSLLRELEEARLKASSLEQYGTVVKAIVAKASISGISEQRITVRHTHEPPDGTVDDVAGWLAAEDYQVELTAEQKRAFGVLLQDVLAQINNFLAPFRAANAKQINPPARSPAEYEQRRLEIERRRSNGS